jgi:uncharacterized protein
MKPTQALSDAELDELDDFLMSDETSDSCMDISALDGFFASLVLNPRLVMPSEYLPWIWDMDEGEDKPSFASAAQANHIMQLVMRYYNSVLDTINGDCFAPLFYSLAQSDGSDFFDAEGWCEGFMCGVFLFGEPWADIFEEHIELLAPMVLLGTEHGWELLEKTPDVRQATQDAYEAIAGSVESLYAVFSAQREAEMQKRMVHSSRDETTGSSKVGRNEACPCGSGKKFKKCCGGPQTVH